MLKHAESEPHEQHLRAEIKVLHRAFDKYKAAVKDLPGHLDPHGRDVLVSVGLLANNKRDFAERLAGVEKRLQMRDKDAIEALQGSLDDLRRFRLRKAIPLSKHLKDKTRDELLYAVAQNEAAVDSRDAMTEHARERLRTANRKLALEEPRAAVEANMDSVTALFSLYARAAAAEDGPSRAARRISFDRAMDGVEEAEAALAEARSRSKYFPDHAFSLQQWLNAVKDFLRLLEYGVIGDVARVLEV